MRSILGGLFWYVHTLSNIGCGPKQYYGLEVRSTKSDLTEGEVPKVVLGIGFSYWGNRPTKTPIPLLTDAGASTVAIITYHV